MRSLLSRQAHQDFGENPNGGNNRCLTGAVGVNLSYFARIVSGLSPDKKDVIGHHGFSSLLFSRECYIPMSLYIGSLTMLIQSQAVLLSRTSSFH